jgi:hypothetical protein
MDFSTSANHARLVVAALTAIASNTVEGTGNTAWTRAVQTAARNLGQTLGFRVCPSPAEGDERQWLYDLVWYRNNDNIRLEMVPLVLESEWSMDEYEIRYDFEKLLLANSPVKVMVFQNRGDTVETVIEKLKLGIDEYQFQVQSVYILACYDWRRTCFDIRTFRKEPPKAAALMS